MYEKLEKIIDLIGENSIKLFVGILAIYPAYAITGMLYASLLAGALGFYMAHCYYLVKRRLKMAKKPYNKIKIIQRMEATIDEIAFILLALSVLGIANQVFKIYFKDLMIIFSWPLMITAIVLLIFSKYLKKYFLKKESLI